MTATGNEVVTLNQLKYTKDKLSSAVAAEATEREKQDGVLESSIATKLGTQSVIAGNNITVTPDDSARTVTISTTNPGFDPNADPIVIGSEAKGTQSGTITIGKTAMTEQYCNNAVAIGVGAQVYSDGVNSVAMGTNAAVRSSTSIAIGNMSNVNDHLTECIALGPYAQCNGQHSLALGSGAVTTAVAEYGTAIGFSSEAKAYNGIAIGSSSNASGESSVAIGDHSYATEASTVSVGRAATEEESAIYRRIVNVADPTNTQDAATKQYVDTVVGASLYGYGKSSIKISKESDASAGSTGSIAIGGKANAIGDCAIALGYNAETGGSTGTAIGNMAHASNYGSTAIGSGAQATLYAVALGPGAKATAQHSVAIGEDSLADEPRTVSIDYNAGNKRGQRRLVGVADPVNAQDAATKAYVDAHAASGGYTLPAATASTLGGVKVGAGLAVTSDGVVSAHTYGRFDNNDTRIAIGTSSTDVMCLGVDSESFMQKNLDNNYSRVYLGLKPATASTLGGVKIGAGINVASDGTISVPSGSGGSYILPAATASTLGGVKIGKYLSIANDGTISRDYVDFETSNYALSIADAIFCDEDGNQSDEYAGFEIFKDGPMLESSFGVLIKPSKEITINGEFCTVDYSVPNEPNYGEKYGGYSTEGTIAIFEILSYKHEESTQYIQFNKKLIGTGYEESIIDYNNDSKIEVKLYSKEPLEANKIYQITFNGKGFGPDIANDSNGTEGE